MSLFDHDDTMQHLILLGILINSAHRADMLALAHAQLAAIPYHKDFKHWDFKLPGLRTRRQAIVARQGVDELAMHWVRSADLASHVRLV